jgi:hypothetical protein
MGNFKKKDHNKNGHILKHLCVWHNYNPLVKLAFRKIIYVAKEFGTKSNPEKAIKMRILNYN